MSSAPLSELCGDLLVVGFEGPTLDAGTARALSEKRRAGVILFRRNIPDVDSAHALCREIVAAAPPAGVFVAVDQEGGRVMRLPEPVIQLPPMRVLGDLGDPVLARRAGAVLGRELSAVGFNVDFAPVLDVDSNPENPIIGDRSFSRDPARVGELGAAFAEGLESAGVLSCGKHFPGHGDTDADSHLELPFVRHARDRLERIELAPFRRAASSVSSLMTAHVVFEALDPGVPATHSRKIVTDLLRGEIGYAGLVFSDDLEMRALAAHHTPEESAVGAIAAGCDVLLACRDPEVAERAHGALVREAERDPAFRARCEEASERSREARRRFPARPVADPEELRAAFARSGAAELFRGWGPET